MTIDELNALTTLTEADEVPVWDKEESGEPTKKITASNLAASVKSLADLPNTTEMNTAISQSTATVRIYSGANGMIIYRVGKLAQLAVFPNVVTTASNAVIGTITDSAFRPASRLWFATKVYNGSTYVDCFVEITTDGVISIKNNMGGIVAGYQGQYVQARGTTYICNGA